MQCSQCNKQVGTGPKVHFRDECPHCAADLHVCKNCLFYDPNAYNECKEVMAERIADKERSNFCDYFVPKGSKEVSGVVYRTREAKEALEALFRK